MLIKFASKRCVKCLMGRYNGDTVESHGKLQSGHRDM